MTFLGEQDRAKLRSLGDLVESIACGHGLDVSAVGRFARSGGASDFRPALQALAIIGEKLLKGGWLKQFYEKNKWLLEILGYAVAALGAIWVIIQIVEWFRRR